MKLLKQILFLLIISLALPNVSLAQCQKVYDKGVNYMTNAAAYAKKNDEKNAKTFYNKAIDQFKKAQKCDQNLKSKCTTQISLCQQGINNLGNKTVPVVKGIIRLKTNEGELNDCYKNYSSRPLVTKNEPADSAWTVSCQDEWCEVSRDSTREGYVNIKVQENPNQKERTAKIEFHNSAGGNAIYYLKQPAYIPATLQVVPDNVRLSKNGQYFVINFDTNNPPVKVDLSEASQLDLTEVARSTRDIIYYINSSPSKNGKKQDISGRIYLISSNEDKKVPITINQNLGKIDPSIPLMDRIINIKLYKKGRDSYKLVPEDFGLSSTENLELVSDLSDCDWLKVMKNDNSFNILTESTKDNRYYTLIFKNPRTDFLYLALINQTEGKQQKNKVSKYQ